MWAKAFSFGSYFSYNFIPSLSPGPQTPFHAMDYERCARLHNQIVETGWQGLGRNLDDLERKTWFEFHGKAANDTRPLLSSDLAAFLERAWVVEESIFSFFYYVQGLHYPDWLFQYRQIENESAGYHRFLTLYVANSIASHPDGLLFDQETNTAILQMSIMDGFTTHNGRQIWQPLETVLEAWLDMINIGKIKAVTPETESLNEKFDPWIHYPYSDKMLDETITAFNTLVEAIESRLPGPPQENKITGIVSEETLKSSKLPPGFAYDFLSKARRPSFHFIAPGLAVPNEDFASQPFFSVHPDDRTLKDGTVVEVPPILLFRSDKSYSALPDVPVRGLEPPFHYPYNTLAEYPAGLYFNSVSRYSKNPFEDECMLVLPYGIGANGYARKSDGSLFGENTEDHGSAKPENRHADLYQPGYNPFTEMHGVRIVHVFRNWLSMIENGDWDVKAEGVVGGIKKWKDADKWEWWDKYFIPITW